jgi:minor extracellular serine protease Vpr
MKRCFLVSLYLVLVSVAMAQSPVPNSSHKLSPNTKLLMLEPDNSALFPLKNGNAYPCTFYHTIEHNIPSDIKYNKLGNVFTSWMTKSQILQLTQTLGLEYIDVSGRLNSPRPLVDTTKILTKVIDVHNGNGVRPFKGKNAIVGVVDIGFEGSHPNFMDANGSQLRVKNWWQQSISTGTKPANFDYGSVYTAKNDIIQNLDPDGSHGTHVTGIAAGSGFTTPNRKYSGMAPEADIAWVTIKYANDTLGGSAWGDYVVANPTILDGYKHIMDYAASVNKPVSINLSWGMHTGPHDGNSLFDLAIEKLVGPGKILVGSAGNSAEQLMHIKAPLNGTDTFYTWAYDRSRNNYKTDEIYCDFWGAKDENFGINISLFDTLGNEILSTPYYMSNGQEVYKKMFIAQGDTLMISLIPNARYAINGKAEILLIAEATNPALTRMRIGMIGNGDLHSWNSGRAYDWTNGRFYDEVKGNGTAANPQYLRGTREFSLGENGGTGRAMISVGSYVARKSWFDADSIFRGEPWRNVGERSDFSSRGPSVDGRTKPDIIAPGQLIAASYRTEHLAGWQKSAEVYRSNWNGEDHTWVLLSGTSMAGPHVCGIVALMLDANPQLTADQAKSIIKATALKDQFTGAEDSNNIYGFGKINALDAVKAALALNNVVAAHPHEIGMYPNPASREVFFRGMPNALVNIYDASGRLVKTDNLKGGMTLNISDLKSGIYLLRLKQDGLQFSTKLIVQ